MSCFAYLSEFWQKLIWSSDMPNNRGGYPEPQGQNFELKKLFSTV